MILALSSRIKLEKLKEGLSFENAGSLEEAYQCYSEAADAGNPIGMFMIGNLYLYKTFHGIEQPVLKPVMMPWDKMTQTTPDVAAAYAWFLKSAQAGVPDAMSNVGVMLYQGQGVEKDENAAKEWLIRAAKGGSAYGTKALKDWFGLDFSVPLTDADYDDILKQFNMAVETGDPKARSLYEKLLLGNDRQLCRLGFRLAVGRYHIAEAFRDYAYPTKSNGRSCAPVVNIRVGWATILIVNRDAFPETEPVIAFSGVSRPIPVSNAVLGETVQYQTNGFGWFPKTAFAKCLKLTDCAEPGKMIGEGLRCAFTTLDEINEKLSPRADEAVIIETGEKEYSAEVTYIRNGNAITLLRYTVGGWDQGDRIIPIPDVKPATDEWQCKYI